MVGKALKEDGFFIFERDENIEKWAQTACDIIHPIIHDPEVRKANLRHGETWFVGVDILPNDAHGAIDGKALTGAWRSHVPDLPLHRAQVSIIFDGYPKRDNHENLPNHRYRMNRAAAHVDGLLPVGPDRRRFGMEYHAYIMAVPLNQVMAAPTVVWKGSHKIMQRAICEAIKGRDPRQVDITDVYQAARKEVFATCEKVALTLLVGQVALIHRFALHGTDIWPKSYQDETGEGRMIAFFRPEFSTASEWCAMDATGEDFS